MSGHPGSSLRNNAFLIAAVALPLVVVGLFLVASAIPRWTVAPPAYDLVVRADGGYEPGRSEVLVSFRVRDGRVVAELRPALPNSYPPQPALYLFSHDSGALSEVRLELPLTLPPGESQLIVPIEALAARRALDGVNAPDGYAFGLRHGRGPGVVGELFGMGRYDSDAAIVKEGRVVRLQMPEPYGYSVQPVAWLAPLEGR
jgi:hypothetical protein